MLAATCCSCRRWEVVSRKWIFNVTINFTALHNTAITKNTSINDFYYLDTAETFDIGIFIYFGRTNMQIRLLNWLHFDSFLWFAGNKSDIFVQIHLQFSFSLSQYSIFQIQLKCDCVETHVLNIRERIILYLLKCVIYNRNIKHQEVWSVRYFICSVHILLLLLLTNVQCSTLWDGNEIAGFQIPTTIRLTNLSSQQIKDY